MSQSPWGNHLEELTSREESRVGYDHQKVAKIEQKTGCKENVNHNSRQNSFGQPVFFLIFSHLLVIIANP